MAKSDDVENESLSLLIPDVQTTSMLVHKAVDHYRWEHLKTDSSHGETERQGTGTEEGTMSIEERYSSIMTPLQFGVYKIMLSLFTSLVVRDIYFNATTSL